MVEYAKYSGQRRQINDQYASQSAANEFGRFNAGKASKRSSAALNTGYDRTRSNWERAGQAAETNWGRTQAQQGWQRADYDQGWDRQSRGMAEGMADYSRGYGRQRDDFGRQQSDYRRAFTDQTGGFMNSLAARGLTGPGAGGGVVDQTVGRRMDDNVRQEDLFALQEGRMADDYGLGLGRMERQLSEGQADYETGSQRMTDQFGWASDDYATGREDWTRQGQWSLEDYVRDKGYLSNDLVDANNQFDISQASLDEMQANALADLEAAKAAEIAEAAMGVNAIRPLLG